MEGRKIFIVEQGQEGQRLDVWLTRQSGKISRARIQQLIRGGFVKVNTQLAKESHRVKIREQIEVIIPPPRPLEIKAENIPLDILFEDDFLLVINKPAGLVVHPAPGHASGTLVNALLHHCPNLSGIGGEQRPGIVHRLDRDTSGVMLVAKTEAAMISLANQFKQREIHKEYLAIVWGCIKPAKGTIETLIGRHAVDRKKMTAAPKKGRIAVTRYETLEELGKYSLVLLKPETGRTHQIRVHLAHLQHPVAGDEKYSRRSDGKLPCFAGLPETPAQARPGTRVGQGKPGELPASQGVSPPTVKRQMLHARKISFRHPVSGAQMEFTAPLPEDMGRLLDYLRHINREIRGQRSEIR